MENFKSEEYAKIISIVLFTTKKVVSQARAEKKSSGDYSKVVVIEEGGFEMKFGAQLWRDSYPPISVNLVWLVTVLLKGAEIMQCLVAPINHRVVWRYNFDNKSDKFKCWARLSDTSNVRPFLNTGDVVCIDNNGKAAFARVEILSESQEKDWTGYHLQREIRLTKEFGHPETLAYEDGYPPHIETYVADDSTREFFGDKDMLITTIKSSLATEVRKHGSFCWHEYTAERPYGGKVEFIMPQTLEETTLALKKKALNQLLEGCQGEFCYGDPRVEKYKEHYMILGEENIATIYKVYMDWLKRNCGTELQEGSDDFVGVAIDWRGREDLQPTFDVTGDVVVVKNNHSFTGTPITNAKEFLEATSGERDVYLMAHFARLFPQAHIDKIECILNDGDEIFYDLYTDGMKSAVTVIVDRDDNGKLVLDIVSTLELVIKHNNITYKEMLENYNKNK